jgi:hypothetical protein
MWRGTNCVKHWESCLFVVSKWIQTLQWEVTGITSVGWKDYHAVSTGNPRLTWRYLPESRGGKETTRTAAFDALRVRLRRSTKTVPVAATAAPLTVRACSATLWLATEIRQCFSGAALSDVTLCCRVRGYRRFEGPCCLLPSWNGLPLKLKTTLSFESSGATDAVTQRRLSLY